MWLIIKTLTTTHSNKSYNSSGHIFQIEITLSRTCELYLILTWIWSVCASRSRICVLLSSWPQQNSQTDQSLIHATWNWSWLQTAPRVHLLRQCFSPDSNAVTIVATGLPAAVRFGWSIKSYCVIDFWFFSFSFSQESVSICSQSPQNMLGLIKLCLWWAHLRVEQESRGRTTAVTCRLISAQGHIKLL